MDSTRTASEAMPAATASTADWARAYQALGLALTPLRPRTKAPHLDDWTHRPQAGEYWEGAPAEGMGAIHEASGTGTFDLDALEQARIALDAGGVDLVALRPSGCATEGGFGRAKRWYQLPAGVPLPTRKLHWIAKNGEAYTVFELRCAGAQDVLPPSIYPETGKPYTWQVGRDPWTLRGFPPLPPELFALWRDWDTRITAMQAADPIAGEIEQAVRQTSTGNDWDEVREEIRRRLSVRDVLLKCGATIKGRRVSCPLHPPDQHPSAWLWTPSAGGAEVLICGHGGVNGYGARLSGGSVMLDALALESWRRNRPIGKATAEIARELGIGLSPRGVDAVPATAATPSAVHRPSVSPTWPAPLAHEALFGPAGAFVRTVLPETESDPAALLFQFLTATGNLMGRNAHFVVGADRHPPLLFMCVVGPTGAGGRKGTSWGYIEMVMKTLDSEFPTRQVPSLASGEGLIFAVRDGDPPGDGAEEDDGDWGVEDKRLLVRDGEFARVLTVMKRDGNPLSAVLRDAWDGRMLAVPTRTNPLRATDAHISVVAHITEEELRKRLDQTEMFNGFANRFLWVCARRSKHLPSGGRIDTVDFAPLLIEMRASIDWVKTCGRIRFSEDAEALFAEVYPALTDGRDGLLGAVTARADAYVRRLALVYALLGRHHEILVGDMQAALAAWRYCEDSASYIFGGGKVDHLAHRVVLLLGNGGWRTRTEVHAALGGHEEATTLDRLRDHLVLEKKIEVEMVRTGGRSAEAWRIAPNGVT